MDTSSRENLKDLISNIINEHSPINHNFEVSWALWLAKTFNIEIDEDSANKIIDTKDSVANLILLDLIKTTTLIQGVPQIHKWEAELKDDVLFSENWLLAYESVKKGWLTPANPTLLEDNLFFKLLWDLDIEFYKTTNQLTPYSVREQINTALVPPVPYEAIVIDTTSPEDVSATVVVEIPANGQSELVEILPSGLEIYN